jgi:hypothetical protein
MKPDNLRYTRIMNFKFLTDTFHQIAPRNCLTLRILNLNIQVVLFNYQLRI